MPAYNGGQFGGGTIPSPGPTITYNGMAAGSTMIIMGVITAAFGHLDNTSQLTSITDDAGNAWQYSTANSVAGPAPPAVYRTVTPLSTVAFIAWCAGGLNPGNIYLADADTAGDGWYTAIIEITQILAPHEGATADGISASPSLSVPLGNAGDVTVGVLYGGDTVTVQPYGFTYAYAGSASASHVYDVTGASGGVAAWTLNSSVNYAAAMMSFSAVPAVPPVTPVPVMQAT